MTENQHILIVDDDPEIRELLGQFLRKHEFKVALAADGEQMQQQLQHHKFDLLVLDLMLPGEDGLSLCRNLRTKTNMPIIMLTALGEEVDRILGLEMGADDYLAKPFSPRELLARIKAVLRRSQLGRGGLTEQQSGTLLIFDNWQLDIGKRELKQADGTLIPLSSGEFTLLQVFAEHPQRVLSRDFLLDHTKGRESGPYDRSIDIQLSRLRRKIEVNKKEPEIIKTIRSGGYQFSLPVLRK
ncbi:response regulator [Thalassotalea psychrophila]|uniref:Response regulator n=1 Tax=Thalassotalea psychrophila TaxID=3065647 RepID=A0ABY9TUB0_9GAMM|nr:response regulator [Colwelliaceae bacterium SQ149]